MNVSAVSLNTTPSIRTSRTGMSTVPLIYTSTFRSTLSKTIELGGGASLLVLALPLVRVCPWPGPPPLVPLVPPPPPPLAVVLWT